MQRPIFLTRKINRRIFLHNNNTKGDWYFYNTSVKSKGFNEFKRVWGKRQNVDNWRRIPVQIKTSTVAIQIKITPDWHE